MNLQTAAIAGPGNLLKSRFESKIRANRSFLFIYLFFLSNLL